jgi:hypothetical protein
MMHIRFSLITADQRVLAAALRMAVVTSLPDIERYIRMRQM